MRYNVNESDLAEQLVVGLMAQGIEVTTLFLRGKPASGMPASKAQHSHYFECGPSDLKGFRRWLIVFRLYRFLRANGFDAVIAHRFKPISMMMWLSQLFRSMVFVGVQHGIGDYDRLFRRVEAAVLISRRWKIVGVSRAVTSYLQRTVHEFSEQNSVTINNA
ncbi:MAG TPA: glycosyltransferase, partial [Pseudomonas sp.]|nr:glycosyltransferase [Pseudomonas sp.]